MTGQTARIRSVGPRDGDRFSEYLALRWDDAATARLTLRPELLNSAGLLLGPVGFALVDYGMAAVLYEELAPDEYMATTNIAINYLGSARDGEVICRSHLDHRNPRTAMLSAEVCHDSGRLLATAIGSFSIFPAAILDRPDRSP